MKETTQSSPNPMSYWGLLSGLAIMLGLPTVTVIYGDNLSSGVQLTIVLLALALGGVIASIAAFFGIVLPSARSWGFRYLCLAASLSVVLWLPWLVLTRSQLPEWMQVVTIILAALTGSIMALLAVFFGLVIPHRPQSGNGFSRGSFGEKFAQRMAACHNEEVVVEDGASRVRVDDAGVQVEDGQDRVQVNPQGVRVQDGKQTIVIDEKGVRIESNQRSS